MVKNVVRPASSSDLTLCFALSKPKRFKKRFMKIIGVTSSDNLIYLFPPVNQTPSLALGHLIYWGLPHGSPFG